MLQLQSLHHKSLLNQHIVHIVHLELTQRNMSIISQKSWKKTNTNYSHKKEYLWLILFVNLKDILLMTLAFKSVNFV